MHGDSVMISNTVGAGLFLLAKNHGHEWAAHTSERRIEEVGWEAASKEANASMDVAEAEAGENSLPAGLRPATRHVTGSGRLSWAVRMYGIRVEVNRPGAGLRGSNRIVGRFTAVYDCGWVLEDVEIDWPQCHLRHIQAVATAFLSGDSPEEVEMMLDEIGRRLPEDGPFAAFAARINGEAAAYAAAIA